MKRECYVFYLYKIKNFSNLQGHPSKLGPIATVTWSGQQPFTVSAHPMLDFSTKYDNEYTCYIILSYMHISNSFIHYIIKWNVWQIFANVTGKRGNVEINNSPQAGI